MTSAAHHADFSGGPPLSVRSVKREMNDVRPVLPRVDFFFHPESNYIRGEIFFPSFSPDSVFRSSLDSSYGALLLANPPLYGGNVVCL